MIRDGRRHRFHVGDHLINVIVENKDAMVFPGLTDQRHCQTQHQFVRNLNPPVFNIKVNR